MSPPPRLLCVAPNPSIDRLVVVDDLVVGGINRPRSVIDVPGGKGLNVARVARQLGGDVTVCAMLGGWAGRWIEEALATEVSRLRVAPTASQSRTCTSILSLEDESLTELYPAGGPVGADEWKGFATLVVDEVAGRPDVLTVSGSLPPGAPVDGIAAIVASANAQGVPALVDAYGEPGRLAIGQGPAVLKVNFEEALTLAGEAPDADRHAPGPGAAARIARRLILAGARVVVITYGPGGAVIVGSEGAWKVSSTRHGGYSVGSGDAFLAGIALGLARGSPLRDAVRLGSAAATANALEPGAGRLDPHVVDGLVPLVEVLPV